MTVLAPERPAPPAPTPEPSREPPGARASLRAGAAGLLASAAAAWMVGGLFSGALARGAAVAGSVIGAAIAAASLRSTRPGVVQALVLPAAVAAGAAFAFAAAGGGASLPRLVSEALRSGGLRQPPVAFDPGWRFVVVFLTVLLGAASVAVAAAYSRPKLAVAVPAPAIAGAALLQPEEAALASSAVAVGLVLGALAVAYGVELAEQAEAAGGFEARRLARGAGIVVALAAAVALISRAGFLFPEVSQERVIPPQRPPAPVPQADRVLFTVAGARAGPWRLGVLDVYDGRGWLLPPYDPARLAGIGRGGAVPDVPEGPTERTTFTIADIEGHSIPVPAAARAVSGLPAGARYDPRTGTVRLRERPRRGLAYTVGAAVPPGGRALSEAGPPPPEARAFLGAPEPPNEVVALLADAPENRWDRLQFVRARFYASVVAAGRGSPVDVPPERVAALVRGGEGSPFEITAAEALLSRWAGVPSRIGFGFYAGDRAPGAPVARVRPRHGATWLEVFFDGHGWVPIVGIPPRARSSLQPQEQNPNLNVRPTDELALVVHVPIRLRTIRLLYVEVRWWLGRVVPLVLAALAAWWATAGLAKALRRLRRRRWAAARGPMGRLTVAYADLRDGARDLGIGEPSATPLRFCAALEPDEEHLELAWLVSRALWGDLRRDLRPEDAAEGEEMARSLARRIARAQRPIQRALAFGSRASLRDPYTAAVPNLWPRWARPGASRAAARRIGRALRRVAPASLLALSLALGACGGAAARPGVAPAFRVPPLPPTLGGLAFRREPHAERAYARAGPEALVRRDGLVYTVRRGAAIEAYLQVARFRAGLTALDREVHGGVLGAVGGGGFELRRIEEERAYLKQLPEQRMLLWFTPDGTSMLLFVARRSFAGADRAFLDVLRFVQGRRASPDRARVPYDPRRGGEA